MNPDTCMCGDVLDEHDDDLACTIEGCPCFYYEENPDA